jgi:hypothetical protein
LNERKRVSGRILMSGKWWTIGMIAMALSGVVGAPGLVAADEAAGAGKPLAVEEMSSGDVEVSLLELKRASGDTVTAKWLFKNTGEDKKTIDHLMSDEYYLVDADAKKKYFCVKDTKNKWVAGNNSGYNYVEIQPGKTFKMWAKFPAPPAATEKVAVHLEGVPPFEDVPLAK